MSSEREKIFVNGLSDKKINNYNIQQTYKLSSEKTYIIPKHTQSD